MKQVHLERESTRYCPNLSEHAHFHDDDTGEVYDVLADQEILEKLASLLSPEFRAELDRHHFSRQSANEKEPAESTTF